MSAQPSTLPERAAPAGIVAIPGGTFVMGSDYHYPEERPAHQVTVSAFLMDATTVTNSQYGAFVAATGYVTVAERPLDPALYPGAKPGMLAPGALVFRIAWLFRTIFCTPSRRMLRSQVETGKFFSSSGRFAKADFRGPSRIEGAHPLPPSLWTSEL